MIYTIEEIKRRVLPVIQKYNIPAMYLFGPMPEGKGHVKSIRICYHRNQIDIATFLGRIVL